MNAMLEVPAELGRDRGMAQTPRFEVHAKYARLLAASLNDYASILEGANQEDLTQAELRRLRNWVSDYVATLWEVRQGVAVVKDDENAITYCIYETCNKFVKEARKARTTGRPALEVAENAVLWFESKLGYRICEARQIREHVKLVAALIEAFVSPNRGTRSIQKSAEALFAALKIARISWEHRQNEWSELRKLENSGHRRLSK